jgi:hypothetical protein
MNLEQSLLLVAALIPLLANIAVLVLRRMGYATAADWIVRMAPLMVVAASSKSREEAIARLTEEVMKLTGPESLPAKSIAVDVVSKSVPPPASAGMLPLALVALLASQTSCTPEQAKTAASIATRIADAACSMLSKDSKEARFACDVIDETSPVVGNLSTAETTDFHRRTVAHVEVVVPLEQADAFAAANGGAK